MENIINKLVIIAVIVLVSLVLIRLFWSRLYEKVKAFKEAFNKVKAKESVNTDDNKGEKSDDGKSDNEVKDAKDGVKTDDGKNSESDDNTKEGAKQPVSGIANELAAAIASIDSKEADIIEAIAKVTAKEKAEAERRANVKRKAFEDEVAKASASIASVLNTPLDQFKPVKTTTRTVAKIKKKKGGDQ